MSGEALYYTRVAEGDGGGGGGEALYYTRVAEGNGGRDVWRGPVLYKGRRR